MGWRERCGAGRPFQFRARTATRILVERKVRGHFLKEIQDSAIDWVEKECHKEESEIELTFYG